MAKIHGREIIKSEYLVNTDGHSDKFYRVFLVRNMLNILDRDIFVHYGRRGYPGKVVLKDAVLPHHRGSTEYSNLVNKKVNNGYVKSNYSTDALYSKPLSNLPAAKKKTKAKKKTAKKKKTKKKKASKIPNFTSPKYKPGKKSTKASPVKKKKKKRALKKSRKNSVFNRFEAIVLEQHDE